MLWCHVLFCLATTDLRADVGKGRAFPPRLQRRRTPPFGQGRMPCPTFVEQTPSCCFAAPPPSSGPPILSLLFARKPVAAEHYRLKWLFPNILSVLPEGCFVAQKVVFRSPVPAKWRFVARQSYFHGTVPAKWCFIVQERAFGTLRADWRC